MIWDGRQWISGILLVEVGLGPHFGLPAGFLIGSTLGYPPLSTFKFTDISPSDSGGET